MECRDFYERKLEQELQRKDLAIISLENLLEALEKSIAEIKDKKESTPYRTVEGECNVLLLSLSKEKEKIEREIEKRLSSLALWPQTYWATGYWRRCSLTQAL